MTEASSIRSAWLEFRTRVIQEYRESKDAQGAMLALFDQYRGLNPEERAIVMRTVVDSLDSPDENVRFDALAMVDEFRITDGLPQLRALRIRLSRERTPGAPYEVAKVDRITARLSETS